MTDNIPYEWFREEFKGRESELETRSDFSARTKTAEGAEYVSPESLSSHFTRYADQVPKVVRKFGKTKWFVASELDDFIAWIKENSGKRTDKDIATAEIARLERAIAACDKRVETAQKAEAKARKDKARHEHKLKLEREKLAFLSQAS